MKKVKVSAPGKIILSGEHAVVYGYPDLLAAVNRRLTVGFEVVKRKTVLPQPASLVKYGLKKLKPILGKNWQQDLKIKIDSQMARLGSGSACRSIPDGFVEWLKGNSHQTSYAHSLYPPNYWQLADVIAVVTKKGKKVSSTEGHGRTESSPFLLSRIKTRSSQLRRLKKALKEKDFSRFGEIIEEETLNMHAVMMTSKPSIIYWLPKTIQLMLAIRQWRQEGLESYFTIDAGATVHIICLKKDTFKIKEKILGLKGIDKAIVNYPGVGVRLVKNHLF